MRKLGKSAHIWAVAQAPATTVTVTASAATLALGRARHQGAAWCPRTRSVALCARLAASYTESHRAARAARGGATDATAAREAGAIGHGRTGADAIGRGPA